MEENIIPFFPPSHHKANIDCIDWSIDDIVAYPTCGTLHFSYVNGNSLQRLFSTEITPYPISCVKFHPNGKYLCIGDLQGRVFFFHIELRELIGFIKPDSFAEKCVSIVWKNDLAIVMTEAKTLCGISYQANYSSEFSRNIIKHWDMEINNIYTKMSIDPFQQQYLLLTGESSSFSVYRLLDPKIRPDVLYEKIELTISGPIKDSQWSYHLPDCLFLVMEHEVFLFNIKGHFLISIIAQRMTSSVITQFCQMKNDHRTLITFHRNGTISHFYSLKDFVFQIKNCYQPKHTNNVILGTVVSEKRDDVVVINHSQLGISLFDVDKFKFISTNFIFPANISCFDTDGISFAYAIESGQIITGLLHEPQICRYSVGQETVTYLSFSNCEQKVYWQTNSGLGYIDINKRHIVRLSSRVTHCIRCFGSSNGALIVQREPKVLGVFINGKERPLLLRDELIDLGVDNSTSTTDEGRFGVLTKNMEIRFYNYSVSKGVFENGTGFKPKGIDMSPVAFALSGPLFVTAFTNGTLLFFDSSLNSAYRIPTDFPNIRNLTFQDRVLYGLAGKSLLFSFDKDIKTCPFDVMNYKILSNTMALVQYGDSIVRFVYISDWKSIRSNTRFLIAPTKNQKIYDFLKNRALGKGPLFFTKDATEVFQCISKQTNLRLHSLYGIGENNLLEGIMCSLFEKSKMNNSTINQMKLMSYLFLDKYSKAAELIEQEDPTSKDFLYYSMLSAFLYSIENGANNRVLVHLKSTAQTLIASNLYDSAAMFLRLGRLNAAAFDYLIQCEQTDLAIRFIQTSLIDNEKKNALLKLGSVLYNRGNKKAALPCFAEACEYHLVLAMMNDMDLIVDAKFLMDYLETQDLLSQYSPNNPRIMPSLLSINELKATIGDKYLAFNTIET